MTSTGTTYDIQILQSILSQLQKNTYNSSGYLEVYVTNESSLSSVDISSPLVNGRVAVELNASTTVSAAQSGTWTVDAVQSGTWTVGVSGTVTVSGTVDAVQSGSWTVAATQSGTWTVGLSETTLTLSASTSTTSATANTAVPLISTSTLCTHFQIAVTAADLVYIGSSTHQAIPLYEYGIFAFDCNPNEETDLSTWYISSPSTSVPYTVIYQSV